MTETLDPGTFKLGRSAVSPQNPKDLRITQFLKAASQLPAAPDSNDYFVKVPDSDWAKSMFGNDQYGDCVFASTEHAVMIQSALSGHYVMGDTNTALKAYAAVTGFNPNDPNTDQGAVEVDALNWERRHSMSGAKVYAFARVDPKDHALLRACAYYFGGVWFGINLPITAQNQVGKVWDVVDTNLTGDSEPGSWGGHAVFGPKYDPDGITVMTWTTKQPMTNRFMDAYVDEAWCRLPNTWEREHDPFQALKWADLKAAVAKFGPVDPRQ
jgi:hypothetical protein